MSRELSSWPPRVLFWCAAAVVGPRQVWVHRQYINPENISYIEIAQSAREAGWRQIPGTHYFIWQQLWLIAAPERK